MDLTDLRILEELQRDARIPNVELARRVGLSATPCLRRVARLEAEGIIQRHATIVDQEKLDLTVNAFTFVTLEKQNEATLEGFVAAVSKLPQVMECYLMTGESDYLLRIVARDLADFQHFLLTRVTSIPGVSNIRTSFALQRVIYRTALPIAAAGAEAPQKSAGG